MRSRIVAIIVGAAILTGGYAVVSGGGGGGGGSWAGSFSCYGVDTSGSCYSLATCTGGNYTLTNDGTPQTLVSAISAAPAGTVICLAAGTYSGGTVTATKSSDVTIQPTVVSNAVTVTIDFHGASHFKLQGVTVGNSGAMDLWASTNMTIAHDTFYPGGIGFCDNASCATSGSSVTGENDLIDYDRFDNIANGAGHEGRLSMTGASYLAATNVGLTISHSHFGGEGCDATTNVCTQNGTGGFAGCSDGVWNLGVYGAVVGPGNEFTRLTEGGCQAANGAHVDPVQNTSGVTTSETITSNWFHDNGDGSGGYLSTDSANGDTIKNNVFEGTGASQIPGEVDSEGCDTVVCNITHNVFSCTVGGTGCGLFVGVDNASNPSVNTVVQDNVFLNSGLGTEGTASYVASYDVNCTGCSGSNLITGTPVFLASPSSGYYHFELDSSSPGYHAGSDGSTSPGIGSAAG